MSRPQWIRELDVPDTVIEKLAAADVHRIDELMQAWLDDRLSLATDLTNAENQALIRAIWAQYIGKPLPPSEQPGRD